MLKRAGRGSLVQFTLAHVLTVGNEVDEDPEKREDDNDERPARFPPPGDVRAKDIGEHPNEEQEPSHPDEEPQGRQKELTKLSANSCISLLCRTWRCVLGHSCRSRPCLQPPRFTQMKPADGRSFLIRNSGIPQPKVIERNPMPKMAAIGTHRTRGGMGSWRRIT